jgi:glycosyltransferase involved in cell wall biosynthesis
LTQAGPIRITVLIDTYNYGRFIEEAIESVLAQDFPPEEMEILVVDDGSTDDTAERVQKYGDRVQFYSKPNGGQASTLNFGFERARGEIVALLDGDDYWLPGKVRRVVDEFEKHPQIGMVYHDFFFRRDNAPAPLPTSGLTGISGFLPHDSKKLLTYDVPLCAALAFRRKVFQRLLPIPLGLTVQADAHLGACVIFVAPILYVAEPFTVHRVHSANEWNWAGNTPAGCTIFEGDAAAKARLERRVQTTRVIGVGVRDWLVKNGFDVRRPELRAFLAQWEIQSRVGEFALIPPGRLRFFRHLVEQLRYQGTRLTLRHRIVNYANAFGSLLVGYRNFHRLDEWRLAVKRSLHSALGRS